MICINFKAIYNALNLDWSNAILGGIVGLVLVLFIEWYRKPKIKFIGFETVSVSFGTLYKLKIKITGKINPGLSELNIKWNNGNVSANWDENPNPLKNDKLSEFVPEMVPQTRYLNTYSGREYLVPIIHKSEEGKLTIFSGWWFGKDKGYGASVPEIDGNWQLQFEFVSQNVNKKSKKYFVSEIIRASNLI